MRSTKIIATIGPATSTPEKIRELANAGVNVCRLNFSHGSYADHGKVIDNIKAINSEGEYTLGIMLDTKGPEVRTGDVPQPIAIKAGDTVAFVPKVFRKKATGISSMIVIEVDYEGFSHDVKAARSILLDNGAIEFAILQTKGRVVIAKALEGGSVGSRRHVNLPGAHISLPSFTEKDWADIEFGVKQGVDFVAASFIRSGDDVRQLKRFLRNHKSSAEVIAKIETPQAVENIDGIIEATDGVMVARGDLGAEVPFEDVPKIQDMIVKKCRHNGKAVIVATHMLESMILQPMPTRAEVTDIAHACIMQADSTMLSGETAGGMYPFRAVNTMHRVLERNEVVNTHHFALPAEPTLDSEDLPRREQAIAASVLAANLKADAIVVISRHGRTARAVSGCRPCAPILAFVATEDIQRKLTLSWGITPFVVPFSSNADTTLKQALELLKKRKRIKRGQRIVAVSDVLSGREPVMSVQIREIRG